MDSERIPSQTAVGQPSAVGWRTRRTWPSTTALIAVTLVVGVVQVSFASQAFGDDAPLPVEAWLGISLVVALGQPFLLLIRRTHPVALLIVTAILTALSALDPLLVLVALAGVAARHRGHTVLWSTLMAAGVTALACTRDAIRPTAGSVVKSFVAHDASPQLHEVIMPWWVIAMIVVVALTISLGIGLLWRTSGELVRTRESRAAERSRTAAEWSRQAERDAVAREAHDTLGSWLSRISLKAAALSARLSRDSVPVTTLRSDVEQLREMAAGAQRDLRSLVDMMRDPATDSSARPITPGSPDGEAPGLSAVAELIARSRAAGLEVSSNVALTDIDTLDPAIDRAGYDVVREALTNAAKHAADRNTQLSVRALPVSGIDIASCSDPHERSDSSDPADPARVGLGLAALRTQVTALHGHLHHGTTEQGDFQLTVHLPWVPRTTHPFRRLHRQRARR